MSAKVTYEREGDVGSITISAPPLNLFDRELTDDLVAAVAAAEQDGPRALMFRAEGEVFTGGVDVHIFHGLSGEDARRFATELIALAHRIEALPFPTLSVVQGLCLTAGFELSLACDMIWASEAAQFGLVEIVVGVTPFMGGTQRVAERAGPARARELVMSGGLYPAATLERWNVINRVLAPGDLEPKSRAFAERLAAGPTLANAATKRIVRAQTDEGTDGADAIVPDVAASLFETEDLKAAVETFLAEGPGKARFQGR
jgi:enoyl-CoA hydratase/carnithine racemase